MPIESFLRKAYIAMLAYRRDDLRLLLDKEQDSADMAFAQAFILRFLDTEFELERQNILSELIDTWPFVISI